MIFHYNYTKMKYGEGVRLLFTDSDSLMYEITDRRLLYWHLWRSRFKVWCIKLSKRLPNLSSKEQESHRDDEVESGGKQISEFVGLRAKLYSYKTDKSEKKKCKGITKNVIIKNIGFEDYKRTILTREIPHRMNCVSSPNDELFI